MVCIAHKAEGGQVERRTVNGERLRGFRVIHDPGEIDTGIDRTLETAIGLF
jgi:hypothetical protein